VQSGYLIEEVSASLLLDCGPGVLSSLRLSRSWPELDGIVISHLHHDHFGDLISWVWGTVALRELERSIARPVLWLPPGGIERLESLAKLLGSSPGMFTEAFVLDEYSPHATFTVGDCELTAFPVPHFEMAAFSLRLSSSGRTLTYSGDCAPSESLVEAAAGANLLLCEATLPPGFDEPKPRGHMTLEEARSIFERSGASELLITHRALELDVDEGIARARDGAVREV